MKVKLSYIKAKQNNSIVDYKEYMKKYEDKCNTYRLLKNAPKIINIEGTYVFLNDLPNIVVNTRHKHIVQEYVNNMSKSILLVWKRDEDGMVN